MSAGDRMVLAANLTWGSACIAALILAPSWGWAAVYLLVGGAVISTGLFVAAFRTLRETS